MDNNELYHYGVKGMKWGIRKQYIKKAGHNAKKKASKLYADIKKKVKERRAAEKARRHEEEIMKKPVKKLTNDELQERAKILESRRQVLALEKSCKDLNKDTMNAGKAFMKDFAKNAIGAAAIGAGKNVLQDYFTKIGKDKLGLKDAEDAMSQLKKDAELWKLKGQIAEGKKKDSEWRKANGDNDDPKGPPPPPSGGNSKPKDPKDPKDPKGPPPPPSGGNSKSDSSTKKSSGNNAESWDDFKNRRSEKDTKSDDDKVYTGEVLGGGTSRRKDTSRPKNDYDYEVDFSETGLATVKQNTSLVSTGSQYVQYLLEDKSK